MGTFRFPASGDICRAEWDGTCLTTSVIERCGGGSNDDPWDDEDELSTEDYLIAAGIRSTFAASEEAAWREIRSAGIHPRLGRDRMKGRWRDPLAALFGREAPKPRQRGRQPKPELTPEEMRQRQIARAWKCGARYSARRWKRQCPPRFGKPADFRNPEWAAQFEARQAFYRGYDGATRARIGRHGDGWNGWRAAA